MVVGWMWLIPSAISAARYLREHWPEKKPFGLKIWFHVSSLSAIDNSSFSFILGSLNSRKFHSQKHFVLYL